MKIAGAGRKIKLVSCTVKPVQPLFGSSNIQLPAGIQSRGATNFICSLLDRLKRSAGNRQCNLFAGVIAFVAFQYFSFIHMINFDPGSVAIP